MPAPRRRRELLLLLCAWRGALALRREGPKQHGDTVELAAAEACDGLRVPLSAFDEYLSAAQPYELTGSGGGRAIVTYAGLAKQSYIDGAAMLGRSLVRLGLGVELWCLVQKDMAADDKRRLEAAGWRLRETDFWLPEKWVKRNCGYWHDAYNKVDIFRLPFERILYLDADTFVFGKRSDLLQLLNGDLQPGQIKMVRDVNGHSYNSGVMVFSPGMKVFRDLHELMARGQLDQPSINQAFRDRIVELPARYNVHGYGEHNCSDVVVAHYTGLHKPAEADAANMELVRGGSSAEMKFGLSCANLYADYFRELQRCSEFLSPALRSLLDKDSASADAPPASHHLRAERAEAVPRGGTTSGHPRRKGAARKAAHRAAGPRRNASASSEAA